MFLSPSVMALDFFVDNDVVDEDETDEVDAEEDGNFAPPRGNLSANNDDGDDGLDAW